MASNSGSMAWFLPFMALAPMGLAHCMAPTGPVTEEPSDGGPKTPEDSGVKAPEDAGKTPADSGMKAPADASPKQPADGATPPDDDGGPATPPDDAGGAPHDPGSVSCNGAPCDVSHGYVCCVTLTAHGITEACNPPHSTCWGHTVACDEQADCDNGVCCQDFPSGGLAGSASCKDSCNAHVCR